VIFLSKSLHVEVSPVIFSIQETEAEYLVN
jgi:hypothetical protein